MANANNGHSRANANPSKSFFIAMLTRDIDLVDCILDFRMIGNSVSPIIAEAVLRAVRNKLGFDAEMAIAAE